MFAFLKHLRSSVGELYHDRRREVRQSFSSGYSADISKTVEYIKPKYLQEHRFKLELGVTYKVNPDAIVENPNLLVELHEEVRREIKHHLYGDIKKELHNYLILLHRKGYTSHDEEVQEIEELLRKIDSE